MQACEKVTLSFVIVMWHNCLMQPCQKLLPVPSAPSTLPGPCPLTGIPLPPGVTQPIEDAEDPHQQQQQQQQQQQAPKPEERWGELGLHHAH
jgi:hypothetical protein